MAQHNWISAFNEFARQMRPDIMLPLLAASTTFAFCPWAISMVPDFIRPFAVCVFIFLRILGDHPLRRMGARTTAGA